MRRYVALLMLPPCVLSACGDDQAAPRQGSTPTEPPARYTSTVTVLENPHHGPELCVSVVLESYPPQCGGVPVEGWDWSSVEFEHAIGVSWGEYTVTGTFDGERLTLTEPARPPKTEAPPENERLGTPCPAPPGGWTVVDRASSMNGYAGLDAVAGYTTAQPDHAATWLDGAVLNVAFTGDVDRHEQTLRSIWGGALCVSTAERSSSELDAIGAELGYGTDPNVLGWSADGRRGIVIVGVVVDDGFQAEMDLRWGPDVIDVWPALRPVDELARPSPDP